MRSTRRPIGPRCLPVGLDMNDYMRENKIEEVPPQIAGVAAKPAAEEVADAHVEKRPAKGSESKAKDKPKARES